MSELHRQAREIIAAIEEATGEPSSTELAQIALLLTRVANGEVTSVKAQQEMARNQALVDVLGNLAGNIPPNLQKPTHQTPLVQPLLILLLVGVVTLVGGLYFFGEQQKPSMTVPSADTIGSTINLPTQDSPVSTPIAETTFESFEINRTEASPLDGFSVTATTIDVFPDNTMRWNLLFSNESAESGNITIDYSKSYVSDEQGNRYEMLQDSANTSPRAIASNSAW
jgi:hypothetical protein